MVRPILGVVGGLLLLAGLLWIGQGFGWVRWPAESFMIDQRPWALRGGMLVAIGAVLVYFSRRR